MMTNNSAVSLVAILAAGLTAASAATISVTVSDAAGNALPDAAVYAEPVASAGTGGQKAPHGAQIEQRRRKFLPLVTVVQTGSAISFPNNDTVRHHVYSFSPAKPFELKLYSGVPGQPILFDKPGTVVVGCNIHDQMVAYILVVDTPYFGKTDAAGTLTLEGVPAGQYTLKAWHYQLLQGAAMPEQAITLVKDAELKAGFKLTLKPNAIPGIITSTKVGTKADNPAAAVGT